jgi:hypothetical protein
MAEPEKLPFPLYHGTSTWFLPSMLEHGFGTVNVHEDLRSREFLSEGWSLRLELAEAREREELIMFPGNMISAMIEDRVTNGGFNFRYGQFYCTAEEWKAVNYASNPCGSELVSEAAKLLCEVREISPEAADDLVARYPQMAACLAFDHQPIVLKLDGVGRCSVNQEDGKPLTSELDDFHRLLSFEVISGAVFSTIAIFRAENVKMGFAGAESYDLVPFENGAA